jgi:hypothetical protein
MGSKGFENDRVVGRELIEDVPIHCKIAENLPSYLAQDKRPCLRPRMVAALTSVAVVISVLASVRCLFAPSGGFECNRDLSPIDETARPL